MRNPSPNPRTPPPTDRARTRNTHRNALFGRFPARHGREATAMKIGMITDSLPDTDFETLLATAATLKLDMLEFGCGNWSAAPHLKLDRMLESETERSNFTSRLSAHGIAISALHCSGNPLHPGEHGGR